jgi:hypothetical protein
LGRRRQCFDERFAGMQGRRLFFVRAFSEGLGRRRLCFDERFAGM